MDRNIVLEFVRVTEAAAICASKWMGKGDKLRADQAAVDAMRRRFNSIDFRGRVVIGEGEKDEAPMLFDGEELGSGSGMEIDLAVDPLECTANLSQGKPNAISVLAAGPKGSLLDAPGSYADQLAVGKEARGAIDIRRPVGENLVSVSKALGKKVDELTVMILERPRHEQMIKDVREAGARIRLIEHGTITAAIATAMPDSGVDIMMGIGGAPEAVISAVALKCLGGEMQAVLKPHNEKARKQVVERNLGLDKVYKTDDIAKGDQLMFAATGISDGPLLKGIVITRLGYRTHSIAMRTKTGTVRYIEAHHHEGRGGK